MKSLNKYFERGLELLSDMYFEPKFSEEELQINLANWKDSLKYNMEKTRFVATNTFDKKYFGNNHPYGHFTEEQDYKNIARDDLIEFHKQHANREMIISISGKVPKDARNLLNKYFGKVENKTKFAIPKHEAHPEDERRTFIEKKDSVQSSIVIGGDKIERSHTDYPEFTFTNFLLGGGMLSSRLMQNVREDKGYSYGIYARSQSYKFASYFYIQTDVNCKFTEKTIAEIYKEIDRLKNEPVGKDEIERAQNFLLSDFADSLDGPYNTASAYINNLFFEIDTQKYYDNLIEKILNITPEKIRESAKKYFKTENLLEVIVGKV
jgi:predicted Zn-dependent peptidase